MLDEWRSLLLGRADWESGWNPKANLRKFKIGVAISNMQFSRYKRSFSSDVNCQERTYHSELWVHDRYRLDQFTCQITIASLLSVWTELPRTRIDIWSWSIAAALARKLIKRFCFNNFRYFFQFRNRIIDNSILLEEFRSYPHKRLSVNTSACPMHQIVKWLIVDKPKEKRAAMP